MRPCMGKVSLRTASARLVRPVSLRELMPRSDRARLIDFAKLRGVVLGSRRSSPFVSTRNCTLVESRTGSQFVDFYIMASYRGVESGE